MSPSSGQAAPIPLSCPEGSYPSSARFLFFRAFPAKDAPFPYDTNPSPLPPSDLFPPLFHLILQDISCCAFCDVFRRLLCSACPLASPVFVMVRVLGVFSTPRSLFVSPSPFAHLLFFLHPSPVRRLVRSLFPHSELGVFLGRCCTTAPVFIHGVVWLLLAEPSFRRGATYWGLSRAEDRWFCQPM